MDTDIAVQSTAFPRPLQSTNITHPLGAVQHSKMHDVTGKMLDEKPTTDFRRLVRQRFTSVVKTGEPFHAKREQILDDRSYRYETIILPLSNDGAAVDMLLVDMVYAKE